MLHATWNRCRWIYYRKKHIWTEARLFLKACTCYINKSKQQSDSHAMIGLPCLALDVGSWTNNSVLSLFSQPSEQVVFSPSSRRLFLSKNRLWFLFIFLPLPALLTNTRWAGGWLLFLAMCYRARGDVRGLFAYQVSSCCSFTMTNKRDNEPQRKNTSCRSKNLWGLS